MTEFWLSGPIDGVAPLLMPAAHTFLQVRHDVPGLLSGLSLEQIWLTAGQSASIGFHAVHIAGATDRLMTYARGKQLTDVQLGDMRAETAVVGLAGGEIVTRVLHAMDSALAQIRTTSDDALLAAREVGRKEASHDNVRINLARRRTRPPSRGTDRDAQESHCRHVANAERTIICRCVKR